MSQQTMLDTHLEGRCEASTLARALKLVLPFATGTLASYHGVRLTADAGALQLEATNGDQKVTTSITCNIAHEGQVVVPARVLEGFIRSVTGAVELAVEDAKLVVRAGASHLDLRTIERAEWPVFSGLDSPEFDLTPYWSGIKRVMWAEAPAGDAAATGHCIRFAENHVVVACGNALASFDVPKLNAAMNVPLSFMVPLERSVEGEISGCFGDRLASFRSGATEWITRSIADSYWDWQRLIRADSPHSLVVSKADLLTSLSRTGLLPEDSGFRRMTMTRLGDELVLAATGPDVGTITDVITCEGTYEDDPIILSIDRLKSLANNTTNDEITFEILDRWHSIVVRDDDWTALIMPLRPKDAAPPSTEYPASSKATTES